MQEWVLIIIITTGGGFGSKNTSTTEVSGFNSKEICMVAAEKVRETEIFTNHVSAVCVRKR